MDNFNGSDLPDFNWSNINPGGVEYDLWHRDLGKNFVLYISPFLIILGCFCNAMSFIVLQSPLFRMTPCGYLLSALAVSDSGVLLNSLLRLWIKELADFDVRLTNNAACKANVFFNYAFPQISSWTLVLVTADRVVSVAAPLRSKEICSFWRMVTAWLVIIGVITLINIFPVTEYSLVVAQSIYGEYRTCNPVDHTFANAYSWVDMLLVALIPMIFIFSSNIFIVIMLRKAAKRRQTSLSVRGRASQSAARQSARNMRSVNIMLVLLGIVFLLTTTPRSIYFLTIRARVHLDYSRQSLMMHTSFLIYHVNNAVNFALYCLSGSRFRLAMTTMFCGKDYNRRRRSSVGHTMSRASDKTDKRRSSEGTQVSSLL